jgi:hypothetical protein
VDGLASVARSEARFAAFKVEQVYQLSRFAELNIDVTTSHGMRPWSQAATARRTAISEVALALRIPERSAESLIEESRMLVERLPLRMAGLRGGDFSYRHAKSIVNHAGSFVDELHSAFETAVLPAAPRLTFAKFDQKARTTRERMDAATIADRHEKSIADREVFFEPARDGMGWLHLYTTATIGLAAHNRADEMARALQGPDETRTLTQLRHDVVADLLLDGVVVTSDGTIRPEFGIRPSVVVTVPVLAMLGHPSKTGESDLPILEGYGPIDLDTATRLAGAAKSWLRTDPSRDRRHAVGGAGPILGSGRAAGVPAAQGRALRAFLQRRDGTCHKPGCSRPAIHCDIDHTQEWRHGGQTAHDNLAHLCPAHHHEKHHTGVTIGHLRGGDIQWTTPSGRTHTSEPANRFTTARDLGLGDGGGLGDAAAGDSETPAA